MSGPWKALKNVKKAVSKKPVAKKKAAVSRCTSFSYSVP